MRAPHGILGLIILAGCIAEEPPPVPQEPALTSPADWCTEAGKLLGHPYASDWQKAAVYEKMQNRGCMK